MPVLVAILIAIAATYAIKRLVDRATAAGQRRLDAARTRYAQWRQEQANRPRPGPSPLAIRAGAIAGGVVAGARLAWDAGLPGWRLGWALGREKVRDWWARRQEQPVEQAPEPEPPVAEPEPEPDWPTDHPTSPPNLRVIRNPEPATGGVVPVVETIGEVRTIADVRAGVQKVIDQYRAELDDANAEAARKRASLEQARSLAEQSAAVLDRDPDSQSAVNGLVEPAQQAWLNAQARAANIDVMLGAAERALAVLNRHRAMEEAAAATPQASTRTETYQPQ